MSLLELHVDHATGEVTRAESSGLRFRPVLRRQVEEGRMVVPCGRGPGRDASAIAEAYGLNADYTSAHVTFWMDARALKHDEWCVAAVRVSGESTRGSALAGECFVYADGSSRAGDLVVMNWAGTAKKPLDLPENSWLFAAVGGICQGSEPVNFVPHYALDAGAVAPVPATHVPSSHDEASRWPHACPRCGGPAYSGLFSTECRRNCAGR